MINKKVILGSALWTLYFYLIREVIAVFWFFLGLSLINDPGWWGQEPILFFIGAPGLFTIIFSPYIFINIGIIFIKKISNKKECLSIDFIKLKGYVK